MILFSLKTSNGEHLGGGKLIVDQYFGGYQISLKLQRGRGFESFLHQRFALTRRSQLSSWDLCSIGYGRRLMFQRL